MTNSDHLKHRINWIVLIAFFRPRVAGQEVGVTHPGGVPLLHPLFPLAPSYAN